MDAREEDRLLGQILLDLKLVTPDGLEAALREQARLSAAGTKRRLGAFLVEQGALSPDNLVEALEMQGKTLMVCSACDQSFNIVGYDAGRVCPCPVCGTSLYVPGLSETIAARLGASATRVMPAVDPAALAESRTAATPPPGPRTPLRPTAAPTYSGRPFGRYRLLDALGAGGMGVVWRAWDTELLRVVALKQLKDDESADPAAVERFHREARLAAKLRHPGIVAVHDVGEIEGKHFLTMDFVEGRTFAAALDDTRAAKKEGSRRGMERVRHELLVLADVAAAVACAHELGIVHRDLKPSNVLLDGAGHPFVMDFGLAKEVRRGATTTADERRRPALTLSGASLGTPAYMSPEQATADAARIGPRSDVWGLGVMLYEVLTGETPFEREGAAWDILAAVVNFDPPRPRTRNRHAPEELEAVAWKALEKDPERRYRTATEFEDELRRWLRGEPVAARRPGLLYRAWRWSLRRRATVIPAAAVAAVLLAALLWTARTHSQARARGRTILEKVARSVGAFEDRVMREPMSAGARRTLAEQPLELLDALVADDPNYGPAYSWRGKVRALLDLHSDAEADFDRGCELSADLAIVWNLRGMYAVDKYARARGLGAAYGEEFAPLRPETADERAWKERGLADLVRAFAASGATDESAAEELDLGRAAAALHLGNRDGWEEALRCSSTSAHPRALKIRGQALLRLARFDEAVEAFGLALDAWPQDPDVLNYRAYAWSEAAMACRRAGADPRDLFRRAIDDFDKALRRTPDASDLHYNRANALMGLGDEHAARGSDPCESLRAAIDAYSEALRRDPAYAYALNNRGNAHFRLGDAQAARGSDPFDAYRAAEADLKAAAARGTLEAGWNLGLLDRAMGRYPDSLEAFRACARGSPEQAEKARPEIEVGAVLARLETRPWAQELSAAKSAFEAGDRSQARWRYRKALAVLDDVLRDATPSERENKIAEVGIAPALAAAHYDLACLEAAGSEENRERRDRALSHLEEALRLGYDDALEPIEADDNLASLRGDPRFAELLARKR